MNNIPLCVCVVCVYHGFFIYSSIDGYKACFHVLTIPNNTAVNTGPTGVSLTGHKSQVTKSCLWAATANIGAPDKYPSSFLGDTVQLE